VKAAVVAAPKKRVAYKKRAGGGKGGGKRGKRRKGPWGGRREGSGPETKVPGKTWEDKNNLVKKNLGELRQECRQIHAPGAPEDGPIAQRYFRVRSGPSMMPPQGHVGPRLKNKDGSSSVRHQCQGRRSRFLAGAKNSQLA
jgi:hypothetical protein